MEEVELKPNPGIDAYTDRERGDGEGPERVGEYLEFSENMYALCFIAQALPMYKEACEQ